MLKYAALLVAVVFVASVVGDEYEDLSAGIDKAQPFFLQCLKEKEAIVAEIGAFQVQLKSYIAQRKSGVVPAASKAAFLAACQTLITNGEKFIGDEGKALGIGGDLVTALKALVANANKS